VKVAAINIFSRH